MQGGRSHLQMLRELQFGQGALIPDDVWDKKPSKEDAEFFAATEQAAGTLNTYFLALHPRVSSERYLNLKCSGSTVGNANSGHVKNYNKRTSCTTVHRSTFTSPGLTEESRKRESSGGEASLNLLQPLTGKYVELSAVIQRVAACTVEETTSKATSRKAPVYSPAETAAYAAARLPATYAVLYKARSLLRLCSDMIAPCGR